MSELNLKTNMTELERVIANHDNHRMAVLFPDVVADLQTFSARVKELEKVAYRLHLIARRYVSTEEYDEVVELMEKVYPTPAPADLSDDEDA